ncbi:MAG: DUF421 domain-containing protein [Chloroflexota bacterium]|nr:DUF421 domain-containing protein [Chloroflexota bacterium]MDQ2941655.1 DUF421 domain-containing protein [Chloroflexota bacterium]
MTLFDIPPWELIVRSVTIYLAMVVALRLFGKREIGQFTLFDLVLVLLVANAVQPAMTGPDSSLGGGVLIILTLVVTNRIMAEARRRLPFLRVVLESPPTTIARDGAWLHEAVQQEDIDAEDLETALREHGIASVDEVALAVLEPDGSISVVPRGDRQGQPRPRRRVRVVNHR